MHTTRRLLMGLASGSTSDGVDAALLEAEGVGLGLRLDVRHVLHQPYPRDLRELLLKIGAGQPVQPRQLGLGHRLLGEAFAASGRQVADAAKCSLQQIHCAGVGGHPAWHESDGRYPSTLGLGMAAVVAERTGITVVSDFRSRDLAAGGQGTSLTALVDHLLFGHMREARALVHLGGLASVVFLPAGSGPRVASGTRPLVPDRFDNRFGESSLDPISNGRKPILGFHAGPCNVLLDALMRQMTGGRETFDPGGKHAVQGCCIEPLVERWLSHPSIQRRPPRTVPMHTFSAEFAAQAVQQALQLQCGLHDVLCTATHFVARCVGQALTRYLPEQPARVLVSGGGVRNGFLWKLLEQQMPGLPLERIDNHGVPAGARKAAAFATLAALTLDGVPANLTTATGASASRLLGSLTPGSAANWARCVAWMGSMAAPLAA